MQVQQSFLRLGMHTARGGVGCGGEKGDGGNGTGEGTRAVFNWISTAQQLVERHQAFPRPPSAAAGRGNDASHSPQGRRTRRSSRVKCDGCQSSPSGSRQALHAPRAHNDSAARGGGGGCCCEGNGEGSCEAVLGFAGGDGSFKQLHEPLEDGPPLCPHKP